MTHIPEDIRDHARAVRTQLCLDDECSFDAGCGCVTAIAQALMEERERLATILKDPAAVRVNYLRGDIACQVLIDEATAAERERCARIAEEHHSYPLIRRVGTIEGGNYVETVVGKCGIGPSIASRIRTPDKTEAP